MEQREEALVHEHFDDAELKALYVEHQELKRQLEEFRDKLHLSNEEEIEKKRLQKRKLSCKDRIMEILARYR